MKRLAWIFVLFFAFSGLGALASAAQDVYRPAPRYYAGGYYRPAYYRGGFYQRERWERRQFRRHQIRERRRFLRHERRERWEYRHGLRWKL